MNRLVIGVMKSAKDGGWEGDLKALTLKGKLKLSPNDDRKSADAPAFRVLHEGLRVGDAWEGRWGQNKENVYYRVTLDDPQFARPLSVALFPDAEGVSAQLVWSRPVTEDPKSTFGDRGGAEQGVDQ
ncbi:MAG: DUF736 family protein [Caulobacter sp.]